MTYREVRIAKTNRTTNGGTGELTAAPVQFCWHGGGAGGNGTSPGFGSASTDTDRLTASNSDANSFLMGRVSVGSR